MAQDNSDSEVVLLMATTCEGNPLCGDWYQGTRSIFTIENYNTIDQTRKSIICVLCAFIYLCFLQSGLFF